MEPTKHRVFKLVGLPEPVVPHKIRGKLTQEESTNS